MTHGEDEAGPDGAEFARLLPWLLPGLPPDERAQIGRELAREARDTYAARGAAASLSFGLGGRWVTVRTGVEVEQVVG